MPTRRSEGVRGWWKVGMLLVACGGAEPGRLSEPRINDAAAANAEAAAPPAVSSTTDASAAAAADATTCRSLPPVTSPLALAALAGDVAVVRKALATGTPVDDRQSDEPTPLMMAFAPYISEPGAPAAGERARRARKLQAAKLLLSKGADVRLADGNGMMALHRVVTGYDPEPVIEEWVAALLKAGAPVDARTCAGATPAMMAADAGRARVVELLNAGGAPRPNVNLPPE